MQTATHSRLLALLSPLILANSAPAQTAPGSPSDCAEANCSEFPAQIGEKTPSDDTTSAAPAVYSASLNGTGPISLVSSMPGQVLLGVGVSAGFDSNPNNSKSAVSSGFTTVNPYLGLRLSTPRSQTLVQYNLTNTSYNSSYSGQMLHAGSVRHLRSLTDRWTLDFDALGTYGENSIRFLGVPQTLVAGNVQGAGPESAAYLAGSGNVGNLSVAVGATYQLSSTKSLHFQVTDGTTHFSGLSQSNSIATETVSFARNVSPTLEVSVYAQGSHYYGSIRCDSVGSGVGLQWLPSEKTIVSVSGGPQLDAPNCGAQQGAAYSLALTRKLTGRSEFYILTKREPGTSYLGPGLWQDSASVGYARQITRAGALRFNFAYLHSLNLNSSGSYNPIYLDAGYEHHVGRSLHASFTYRAYTDLSGGATGNRKLAMVSVSWSPDHAASTNR